MCFFKQSNLGVGGILHMYVYVNKFISEISIGEVIVEAEASKNTIN